MTKDEYADAARLRAGIAALIEKYEHHFNGTSRLRSGDWASHHESALYSIGNDLRALTEHEDDHERDPAAELRAACEAAKSALTALNRVQMYGSADMVRDRAKRALDLIDAALAATEGSE